MASSLVEQYERILAADPRSRVFVDLARALLARGEARKAADTCRRGLAAHPGSIQARILLGRALLRCGEVEEALSEFQAASEVEPSNPYALNLASEALVEQGLAGRALALLERAAALQPGNPRVLAWLGEARSAGASGTTEGGPVEASREEAAAPASANEGEPAPREEPAQGSAGALPAPAMPRGDPPRGIELEGPTAAASDLAGAAARSEAEAEEVTGEVSPASAAPGPPPESEPVDDASDLAEASALEDEVPPPPLPPHATPPPLRLTPPPVLAAEAADLPGLQAAGGLLGELPPGEGKALPEKKAAPDVAEAERIAASYEHALREEMLAASPPAKFAPRRQFFVVAGAAAALLALGGGALTYYAVRNTNRVGDARVLAERARRGILRDTDGSLREASRALAEARSLDPKNELASSLLAVAAALRSADQGDAQARSLAKSILAGNQAKEAAPVVRYLLADSSAERGAAAEALARSPHTPAGVAEAVAAEALLSRGAAADAELQLEGAARANPPSLRALVALARAANDRGEPEEALPWADAALAAHATHPGAALAAAEARLHLRRDLGEALARLRAVEKDPGSPPRLADRLRFELAMARLLAANGEQPAALERLARDRERFPKEPALSLAEAEIRLAKGDCDDAEGVARRGLAIGGGLPARLLVARAQACQGRYAELLRTSAGQEARELKVMRTQALLALGQPRAALEEIESIGHGGRMSADAAAWYAVVLDALGRRLQAQAVVDRLLAIEHPPAQAFATAAAFAGKDGRIDEAEALYRRAAAADPELAEAHCGLGRLLLGRGRGTEAAAELSQARSLAPAHVEALVALGEARLLSTDVAAAKEAFRSALARAPGDGAALRGLAEADLADGNPAEARASAEKALRADPRAPETWLTAAKVALARGDRKGAAHLAERARKLSPNGPAASEAARLIEEARRPRG